MPEIDPHDIHRLDQAAPAALMAVDALALDPETSRRLATKGEAVYGMELTRDLALACDHQPLTLAGWAAFATIRLVQGSAALTQARADLEQVRAERAQARADLKRVAPVLKRTRAELNALQHAARNLAARVRHALPGGPLSTIWREALHRLDTALNGKNVTTSPTASEALRREQGINESLRDDLAAAGAVIDAARAWQASLAGLMDDTTPAEDDLADALDAYDTPPGAPVPVARAQEAAGPCGTCWACRTALPDPLARVVRTAIDWATSPDITPSPLLEDLALREAVDELLAGPVCPARVLTLAELGTPTTDQIAVEADRDAPGTPTIPTGSIPARIKPYAERAAAMARIRREAAQLREDLAAVRVVDELGTRAEQAEG